MIESIVQLFNRQVPLQAEDRALLAEYWSEEILELKRNDHLLRIGQTERYLYFVLDGALRIYFPTQEGDEICVGFGYLGTLLSAVPSFLRQAPSEFGIQALRQCRLLRISRSDFYTLKTKSAAVATCWQLFLEEALIGLIERESAMLIQDPRERLQKLLQRSPHIFQLVPQKHIASYLRMSPETLSRIFKEL